MTQHEMVSAFMQHIGSETPTKPVDRGTAIEGIRTQLMLEEFRETHAAMLASDLVEVADGLADLAYVVVGTAVAYGLPIADAFKPPVGKLRIPDATDASALARNALPHLMMAVDAMARGDLLILEAALEALNRTVAESAASIGILLREVFAEVQRSNLTKSQGRDIGPAKYPPGGKGPNYQPPSITGILGLK
jgi:predicted HAD superfamily Cof-like phosphohydrolase